MKTILLLRHAKSSWNDSSLSDHDRPLNARGKRDAPRVGELLAELALVPDIILCSTAKRARKTAKKAARACGFAGETRLHEELYLASPDAYLAVLQNLSEDVERPLLVGHNPGMEQLLGSLTGCVEAFPTAALARIELDVEKWRDVTLAASGKLAGLWRPKDEH